ncbi:MAG: hypothetical protein COB20_15315 [SAR86 cluster bacterium]|uniref:Uncharacterized protein n=1 Tax=SAR86 cluster bacterium TaxID=2030880 RepID=A0A2A4WWX0_9GAMM|nr:MAG: hypothetical protein COB20_15315 [SAR86 cluster bacterium]
MKWFFNNFLGGIVRTLWWLITTIVGLLFKLAFFVIGMVGRVIAALIGFAMIMAGFLLSLTGIGAIIGVPISIIGSFIFVKAALP